MKNKKFISIKKNNKNIEGNIYITGSKSESNRLLILKYLYPNIITINNLSNSDDTNILKKYLEKKHTLINVGHAGTTIRFLIAYFSIKCNDEIIITGSNRMKERPILKLVESLIFLGANIKYLENIGYPPIKIKKSNIQGGLVKIDAKISSQYISALMLIGSSLEKGLEIEMLGNITSLPYINMTFCLLKKIGINILWEKNKIKIFKTIIKNKYTFNVESDWSSASYYYSLAALSDNCNLNINNFYINSIQGDSYIKKIFKIFFGINTIFNNNKITLIKSKNYIKPKLINLNLIDNPDIAQTIAVTCFLLKIKCKLSGLGTLKVKETDRLYALKKELKKIGCDTEITSNTFTILNFLDIKNNKDLFIETYEDHRMAMSFSIISLLRPLNIYNYNVVSKSYPNFWSDLKKIGFIIDYK